MRAWIGDEAYRGVVSSEIVDSARGAVAAAVVDDNQLVRNLLTPQRLTQRRKCRFDGALFIAGWYDDGEFQGG